MSRKSGPSGSRAMTGLQPNSSRQKAQSDGSLRKLRASCLLTYLGVNPDPKDLQKEATPSTLCGDSSVLTGWHQQSKMIFWSWSEEKSWTCRNLVPAITSKTPISQTPHRCIWFWQLPHKQESSMDAKSWRGHSKHRFDPYHCRTFRGYHKKHALGSTHDSEGRNCLWGFLWNGNA